MASKAVRVSGAWRSPGSQGPYAEIGVGLEGTTSADAMRHLGCGESQLSRLVKAGRLVPAGEWTVGGRRIRYFGKDAL